LVVGPSEHAETEEQLAQDHGALRAVRVGSADDPRPWFRLMDIHLLPTQRGGVPNVPLQAAALEAPTITTAATGACDAVVHEQTGLLVPPAQPLELEAAIERLAADPEARARFAQAARRRVEKHFSNDIVWDGQAAYLARARGKSTKLRHD